ncbi:Putative phage tail protein [Cognatiyoonia koreensis]|uniref:Putative phage tail protein n=1 Tax=Cognatiyoonia koreensis TaxID=364200 RepID=A0A1I0NSY5_9RHOB|nr:glycoside hydrolase/phage tail family protein [Cognatiyoonia koreensis]SEW04564.1 Putative phage tail protein [Cognatiyoonia koreensis]
MATIVLSAAGMALGGSIGGSVLGLSMATIGRAAGATLGRMIDQRILGSGSEPVEVGRVDRFRLTGASEGAALGQTFGRMRLGGQVIWATRFLENTETSGGGKGAGPQPKTTEYSYSVSLAVALCEGEITRVGRVWADGVEIATDTLNMRVYTGSDNQTPDPKIVAVEGADKAPAYRGVAYVVLEDLQLDQFGNRVPQFTFEVMRPSEADEAAETADVARQVQGVCIIPGTGEFALATKPAYLATGYAERQAINVNTPAGGTDFTVSMDALTEELPACTSGLLVVSWFGSDLRCGDCLIAPKVEQKDADAEDFGWTVSSLTRGDADRVPLRDDRPVYGGTPSDASVVQALGDLRDRGLRPVFYPFILMEQMAGNGLPNPWGNGDQAVLPWRGRITLDKAPGQAGSTDGTATAVAQVADFMGTAQTSDFSVDGSTVSYSGPDEWRYRRFILHYAHLCAAAGGVSAFCIGSEMRGLTQIRGPGNSFPGVDALRQLAGDVRMILGPDTIITYAADWSEYHGYQPEGTGDKFFHLDALWADPNIDVIGIDNYMPLSDWRDKSDHADAGWKSIYNLDYLKSNVAGGEGFDWFYHSPEARDAQIRTPITDGDGEPWVWRYKDLIGWWSHDHHDRVDGVRVPQKTAWDPQSKPIWFTEFGCAAINKGTNQPNKFLDPKSSESQLPHYSDGMRDDVMQMQYLRAIYGHFAKAQNNPVSPVYGGKMLDMSRLHVWAWDTRPFPFFPANATLWSDGDNYARGHWLNGRSTSRTLASVIADICLRAGVTHFDVSEVYGVVRGYSISDNGTGRAALQPLLIAYGVEAAERGGVLVFKNRTGQSDAVLDLATLAYDPEKQTDMSRTRAPAAEIAGRVQVGYLDADGDYEAVIAEAIHPDDNGLSITRSEFPIALTRAEGARIVDRWTHEARVAKESVTFALPPSRATLDTGDTVSIDNGLYRIDRIEESGIRLAEATRVVPEVYKQAERFEEGANLRPVSAPTPVEMLFLDLPLLTGDEAPQSPYVAATAQPWPGTIGLHSSPTDSNYVLQEIVKKRAVMGRTLNPFKAGRVGLWDRQAGLEVKLVAGSLSGASVEDVLTGANMIAIGDGTAAGWELVQFQNAEPTDLRTFQLNGFLRGQAGSDAVIPDEWAAGSFVVVMNGTPEQITVPTISRGQPRHYRFGPLKRPLDDPSFRHVIHQFDGVGYRPYRVSHLKAAQIGTGTAFSWIRRTRIDGDIWGQGDVPLGEDAEQYRIEVQESGVIRRTETVSDPNWTYSDAQRQADIGSADYNLRVSQISTRYGPGPARTLRVTGT